MGSLGRAVAHSGLVYFSVAAGLSEIYQQSPFICSHQPLPTITDILHQGRTAVLGKQRKAQKDKQNWPFVVWTQGWKKCPHWDGVGEGAESGDTSGLPAAHVFLVCLTPLSCDTSGAGSLCSRVANNPVLLVDKVVFAQMAVWMFPSRTDYSQSSQGDEVVVVRG